MVSAVALLFLPQLPVASSVVLFPVGVEWLVSERDKLLSFLRRKTGKVAVAVGLAHVAFAVYLQSAARAEPVVAPTVLVETVVTNPVSGYIFSRFRLPRVHLSFCNGTLSYTCVGKEGFSPTLSRSRRLGSMGRLVELSSVGYVSY